MGRQRRRVKERQRQKRDEGRERREPATEQAAEPVPAPAGGLSWSILAPVAVILAAVAVFLYFVINGSATPASPRVAGAIYVPSQSTSSTSNIDGIPCTAEMLTYHVHAHLTIYYEGRPMEVPAYVGIRDQTCLYWLHTHDATGIIHIEAPQKVGLHLGNFFDIWGQPLSATRVATRRVPSGKQIRVYVNGKQYAGNLRNVVLRPHELITIEIGPPFPKPPGFSFPPGD